MLSEAHESNGTDVLTLLVRARRVARPYRFGLRIGDVRMIHGNHVPDDIPAGSYELVFGREGYRTRWYVLTVNPTRDAALKRTV